MTFLCAIEIPIYLLGEETGSHVAKSILHLSDAHKLRVMMLVQASTLSIIAKKIENGIHECVVNLRCKGALATAWKLTQ